MKTLIRAVCVTFLMVFIAHYIGSPIFDSQSGSIKWFSWHSIGEAIAQGGGHGHGHGHHHPVPEPSSLILLATGLAGIGAYTIIKRRRNRK